MPLINFLFLIISFYRLIATLSLLAEELNCYKLSLECKDTMVPYYTSLGFCNEAGNSNYLQLRFSSWYFIVLCFYLKVFSDY